MAFTPPHLDDLTELINADHRNQLPDDDVSRYSDNYKRNRVTAGAVSSLHAHLLNVAKDAMPNTASGSSLAVHGSNLGLSRKGAVAASGENVLLIRGANGSSFTISDGLEHVSGNLYYPTQGGTIGASGELLISVAAAIGGVATNLEAGEVLTWLTTPSGIEDDAELQDELSGGLDQETEGAFRERVLTRKSQGANGGQDSDWPQWVLEALPGIVTAHVYPNRNGLGTVDIAALKDGVGTSRILTSTERDFLLDHLDTRRPITARVRVLDVVAQTQNIEVAITPQASDGLRRDWDDSIPGTVGTWTPATRVLEFAVRPATVQVGSRLIITGTTGKQTTVTALSGANGVVLDGAEGLNILTLAGIYSGGPLIDPIRNAIQNLFDSLGPELGEFGIGGWIGTLFESRLFSTVQNIPGVLDSAIVTPSGDVTPAPSDYPDDASVNMLVSGSILVRYA